MTMREVQIAEQAAVSARLELTSNVHIECDKAVKLILREAGVLDLSICKKDIERISAATKDAIVEVLDRINFVD